MAYNQPYGYPMMAPNIQSGTNDINGVNRVSSFQEVIASTVPYGRALFMHNNEQVFWVKDTNGSIRAFKFEEVNLEGDTVSRKEFDDLKEKYEQLIQQFSANAAPAVEQQSNATQWQQPVEYPAGNEVVQGNAGASQAAVYGSSASDGNEQSAGQPVA